MISTNIGIWIGAIITIAVYTYFISSKQNPIFKFAESTVVGCAVGYTIVLAAAKNLESLAYNKIVAGNFIIIIPVLLGILMYTRFSKDYKYLGRVSVAIIVGSGLAVTAYGTVSTNIFANNLRAVIGYVFLNTDIITSITSILNIIAMVTTIYYFYFTAGKEKLTGGNLWINKIGRYSIMLYMGANFGNTILARNSLIIGRLQYLLWDWLGLKPG